MGVRAWICDCISVWMFECVHVCVCLDFFVDMWVNVWMCVCAYVSVDVGVDMCKMCACGRGYVSA